jgi:hypothetical protein
MSKTPKTATKYEKDDPDYPRPSKSSVVVARTQPKRNTNQKSTKTSDEGNESSSSKEFEPAMQSSDEQSDHSIIQTQSQSNHSISENQSIKMAMTQQQFEEFLDRLLSANPHLVQAVSRSPPKCNIKDHLSMTNYPFWSKSMKAALKLQKIWLDPTKEVEELSEAEKQINAEAASYVLTNIDANNMAQITTENEECFITIWNLLKQFHEPQTASTLVDFYSKIQTLIHRPGECVRLHLLELEKQFEKLIGTEDKLTESHKAAIMLASVKNSPEFQQLFYAAKWMKREKMTLQTVKESIIAAQDERRSGSNARESAHANKFIKKNHTRKPRDPQRGWLCPDCEMDNHKQSDCWKKNNKTSFRQKQPKKQSHAATQNQSDDETMEVQAHRVFMQSSKRQLQSPAMSPSSSSVMNRLGPKHIAVSSPYRGIYPRRPEKDVLEINYSGRLSDSGMQRQSKTKNNASNVSFQSENRHQGKNVNKNKQNTNKMNEFCMQTVSNEIENNKNMNYKTITNWILDSGASSHMCSRKDILSNFSVRGGQFVTISDGSQIAIEGFGTLTFDVFGDDNQKYKFVLEDVAYVPKLKVNLISIWKLTSLEIKVMFTEQNCKIIHSKGSISIGTMENSLYVMNTTHKDLETHSSLLCIHEWHKKLSHRNLDHIRRIKNTLNLRIQKCNCDDQCTDCIKGKISMPPFPKSSDRPKDPRTLVTSDLCGPFKTQSLGGAKYFITFIDAATDYTEVETLRHKSDASKAIMNYMEKCKNKFGSYCTTYRSDRGGEFMSAEVQNFLSERGISFQCTVPNTPAQNGRSEQKNKTLVEGIRTVLVSKQLPHYLWGEALHHVNNTFNSIPKAGKESSPKEEYFGEKISFEFIEFGAPVIFHSNDSNRSKLDPKGISGIFVGHDHNSKGYRIFNSGKILVKRAVRFLTSSQKNEEKIRETCTDLPIIEEKANEDVQTNEESKILRRSERISKQKGLSSQIVSFEPKTYKQAINCQESDEWKKAMQQEIDSINQHETWTLVDLPKDRIAIGSKWVFKIKTDIHGKIIYKARLVAQGFKQQHEVDYDEVFAPVARPTSFRILLTIAGCQGMEVKQFDVKTAFLNGHLEQEIYMKPPQGFESTDKVMKLRKSLYGLKQAARVWNQAISKCLIDLKFVQSKQDNCLYINNSNEEVCYLIIHVDDMLMVSKDSDLINRLASQISKIFELKSLGDAKQFIGINIDRQSTGNFAINQSTYIDKIAESFDLQDSKGSPFPIDPGYFKLNDENFLETNNEYRKIIGMLLYVSTNTRPDIAAAVGILAQKVAKPRYLDMTECRRVIKYLLKTRKQSILLGSHEQQLPLVAYTDANWAEDRLTRKSTSGVLCKVFNSTVSWSSRRQDIISTSTTESEFYALAEAVKEVKWLKALLKDFGVHINESIPIHIDSQSCMKMIENEKFSNRTKHIDVRYHFAKEEILNGNVKLVYEPTETNIADMLTKPLAGTKIKYLRELANVKETQVT